MLKWFRCDFQVNAVDSMRWYLQCRLLLFFSAAFKTTSAKSMWLLLSVLLQYRTQQLGFSRKSSYKYLLQINDEKPLDKWPLYNYLISMTLASESHSFCAIFITNIAPLSCRAHHTHIIHSRNHGGSLQNLVKVRWMWFMRAKDAHSIATMATIF